MDRRLLVGTWKLASFDIEDPSGVKKPWGKNAHGFLIYSPDGYMAVAINAELQGTRSSKNLARTTLFYAGEYEILKDTVLHHVDNASDARRIGQVLVRDASIMGDTLYLTGHGAFGVAHLVWKRAHASFAKTLA